MIIPSETSKYPVAYHQYVPTIIYETERAHIDQFLLTKRQEYPGLLRNMLRVKWIVFKCGAHFDDQDMSEEHLQFSHAGTRFTCEMEE